MAKAKATKMSKVYVVNGPAEWDPEFIAVFSSIDTLSQGLVDIFAEEIIYLEKEEVAKQIKEREERGAVYLFFPFMLTDRIDEDDIRYQYSVRAVEIDAPMI